MLMLTVAEECEKLAGIIRANYPSSDTTVVRSVLKDLFKTD